MVLVLVIAALLFGVSRERSYSAESIVSVTPVEQGLGRQEREVFLESVTGVSASDALLEQTISRTGWRGEFEDFRDRLEPEYFVRENGESGVIVRFSGRSPVEATEVANVYAALFAARAEDLNEQRTADGEPAAEARVRTEAVAGDVRADPGPLFYAAVALVAGLVVGGGVALLLEGRARNWRDARDAEMTLRAPVVGMIPDYFLLADAGTDAGKKEREEA